MATNPKTTALQVSALDFDGVKAAFRAFLKNQDQFNTYDFEGSGMSVLLDVLAYNTHYNAVYSNMLASEMFLDSAVIRENVVSRAKQLGYTPTSAKGATAEVNITLVDLASGTAGIPSITIPKHTKLSSKIGDRVYTFLTADTTQASLLDPYTTRQTYVASNVEIKEGISFGQSFSSDGKPTQRHQLHTENADATTLEVSVNGIKYTKPDSYTSITSTSNVYFLQEGTGGKYEVYFGDGNIGRALNDADSISVTYIESLLGSDGNGVRRFRIADDIISPGGGGPLVATSVILSNAHVDYASSGGAARESVDSIKFLAPLNFESQNRSVTADDYRARILSDIQGVDSVNVWGGEYNNPPEYGKVFISIKSKDGYVISNREKENIKEVLKRRNIASISPTIIDPDFLYLTIDSQVMYDPNDATNYGAIKAMVESKISEYSTNSLNKFNSYFRRSILSGQIDALDKSIHSNLMGISLKQKFMPTLNTTLDYQIKFSNPLFHPHAGHMSVLSSSLFSYYFDNSVYLDCSLDDMDGIVRVVQTNIDGTKKLIKNSGTINYDTGNMNLENFIPITINDGSASISVIVQPRVDDVIPSFNQIISIDSSDVTVTLVDDELLISTERPGPTTSFTASRGTYSTTDTGTGSSSGGTGY